MLTYQVESLPDLTLSKYQVFEDSGVKGMVDAQTKFIRQLYQASLLGNVSVHFLFDYDPERSRGKKIRIRMIFSSKTEDSEFEEKLRKIIRASSIAQYFSLNEFFDCNDDAEYTHMCIMRKKERFLQTVVNGQEAYFYVVPNWKVKDNCRLYNIFKLMESFEKKCCYRVDLFTEKELEEEIHGSFRNPLTYLRNISRQDNGVGVSESSRIHREKKDPNADEVLKQYEDWLKAIDTSPSFLCRVCSFTTDDEQYSKLLVDSALSECLEVGNSELTVKEGKFTEWELLNVIPERKDSCRKQAPDSMKRWPITFTLDEAAAFSRFPVLYDGENVELAKETSAVQKNCGIVLGTDLNNYPVKIPLGMFSKHMFVCGVPGAGKTNTMLHIADKLWNFEMKNENGEMEKVHIPFLVLEPAKREYRELALFNIPELIIFSPSACTDFPLKINPFEFPKGLTLSEHISKLCQVFEGAFPIPAPTPFILDRAIQAVYEKHGWHVKDINMNDKPYPTMSELYQQFTVELENTNYDGEMKGNIRSVLEMRIGSLLRREMKEMFDVSRSTLLPEEWLKFPVIIELEALGEGVANFVTLLLCTLIRETLKVDPIGDKSKAIRHVIFIEEAHNLIAPEIPTDRPEDSNPKIAATAFIVKMLAEVRALREGIIIADQLPSAMAAEVIKNTNIKLVHRLTAQDDRQLVGSTMSASSLQLENMAIYAQGYALLAYEDLLRPFEMKVEKVAEHGENTPSDHRLYELMMEEERHPAYVELCRKREREKWERIKTEVQVLAEKYCKLTKQLENMNFDNLKFAKLEKYIDTGQKNLVEINAYKSYFYANVSSLSEQFVTKERKEKLLAVIGKLGAGYKKMLESKVLLWVKED